MKILLDECIDRRFGRELVGFDVSTVPQMGWAGVKNGNLMRLAEAEFDIFVTVDRNLSYQQNLPGYNICLVVLAARSNRAIDLVPFAQKIVDSIPKIKNGTSILLKLDA